MVRNGTTREPVIQAIGLSKTFRDFWMRPKAHAVQNVDFEVYPNEIFGLLGPNGSGKSTIIKMILGLLHKSRGRLLVFGKPPNDVTTKSRIGFLPEESYLYRYLNPIETLDYYGKLFGLDRKTRRRRGEQLLDMVGLSAVAHRPVGEFSKGMTRRIGLAQALINDPDLLILDEPTSGLDPIGTRQVKDVILELGERGKTILLSSHLLADVEDVCDRMVVLYGGRIRAQGTVSELLTDSDSTIIRTPRLTADTIARIEQVISEQQGISIEQIDTPRQRLEELFLEIVERARQEQVETSGAVSGGETAAFLRGEAEGEGEELIEALVQETAATFEARAVPADVSHAGPDEESARDEVLDELIRPEDQTAAVERSEAPPPKAPQDVDRSMIESLLGDETRRDSDRAGNVDVDDDDEQRSDGGGRS